MTNKTFRGLVAFWAILMTAACAFGAAPDAVIDLVTEPTFSGALETITKDSVSFSFVGSGSNDGAYVPKSYWVNTYYLEVNAQSSITAIEYKLKTISGKTDDLTTYVGGGSISKTADGTYVWRGAANRIRFVGGSDTTDVRVTKMRVWFKDADYEPDYPWWESDTDSADKYKADLNLANDKTDYSKRDRVYSPVNVLPVNGRGVPMAVVSARKYHDVLQPYLKWKTQQGYEVTELYTDEIGGSLSGEELAKAIRTKLKALKPRPVYVLLVGWAEEVPTFIDKGKQDLPHATDFYYGEYTDDYFADAYVGRFSARTVDDVQAQIDKTRYMAELTAENGAWLKRSLVVDNATSGDPIFVPSVKFASAYPLNLSGNTVESSYAAYGTQINTAINNGCSLVSYFGHGSTSSWNSQYTNSDVEKLSNANRYPVVASVTCLTGKYDSGYSLAETFARKKNAGAVAVVACSELSYADNKFFSGFNVSGRAARLGFLRSLFPAVGDDPSQRSRTIGQAVHVGTLAMIAGGATYYVQDFSLFNLFGDPTYQPYLTTPKNNRLTIESTTFSAGAELSVTTVPDAMVCLSRDRTVIVAGVANSKGVAKLYVPSTAGDGGCVLYSSALGYTDISKEVTISGTTGKDPDVVETRIGLSSEDVLSLSTVGLAVTDKWPNAATTFSGKKAVYSIFASTEKNENDATLRSKFNPEAKASTIFLRNKYGSCGIVTMTSGGKARRVKVEWAHPTGKVEVLGVYGSHTAYTSPSDAWTSGREGTKLGVLSNSGKSELIIRDDYEYLLFRAENFIEGTDEQNSVYLKSLSVGWNDGTVPDEIPPEEEEEEDDGPSEGEGDIGEDDPPAPPSGGDVSGGGSSSNLSDYYLPPVAADEWVATIDDSFDTEYWEDISFTCNNETKKGNQLPQNAKVRFEITAKTKGGASWIGYRRIKIDGNYSIERLSFVSKNGGNQPIGFANDGSHVVYPEKLNVQGVTVYLNEPCVKPTSLWIGWEGRVEAPFVYIKSCKTISGVGTLNLTQADLTSIANTIDLSKFKGYVTGAETINPSVPPNPENAGQGGDEDEEGSSGEVIDSNATDSVKIDRSHGYDMTENYWDARKHAIKNGKLLFVLSGSDSCPYCHQAMEYLREQGEKVDAKYVCYYARRQNGDVPMRGGLPQYGAYDPRTIDAFTGCYDENGNFDPTAAWYSGHDHAFASERGFSVPQINKVLAAANDKSVGKFTGFELDVPAALLGDTPTKLRLYANFDDGVKMEVDHEVEWLILEGKASITPDGVITAKAGQTIRLSIRNAFYDFNAEENAFERSVKVVSEDDVKELRIVSESFNLEDNPDVRLKAEVVLKDGTVTAAAPEWSVSIARYLPLPENAPIYQRTDGLITLDPDENGHLYYHREEKNHLYDGIDLQDHVLSATAKLGDKTVSKEVTVYGPTRIWVTDWDLLTPNDVAPGSVIRADVKEMKYIYGGNIYTTKDKNFAEFSTGYVKNMMSYSVNRSTSVALPMNLGDAYADGEQIKIRVEARKKGGKYSGSDYDTINESVRSRVVTLRKSSTTHTSKNGIRVNEAWLKIYYPERTDFAKLVDEDTDEDGFTTAEEYVLGTDPRLTEDRWAFTPCHFDWPGEIYYRVMFMNHTFAGRLYTIEGAESQNGTWYNLGTLNLRRDSWMADENVSRADSCRIFRVTVQIADENELSTAFTVPGYAVWKGITLKPGVNEKYAALTVDSNDLDYPLTMDFSTTQDLSKPVFSVPSEQVMTGTLERFVPTAALQRDGWKFVRKTNGIWTEFYAMKGIEAWDDVTATTDYAHIPGLKAADASALKKAACTPKQLADWARGRGKVSLGSEINLDCFIMNAANGDKAPELKIDEDDLKAIISGDHTTIKAKYPNAKVEVKDVTDEICGSNGNGVKLYTLILSL